MTKKWTVTERDLQRTQLLKIQYLLTNTFKKEKKKRLVKIEIFTDTNERK